MAYPWRGGRARVLVPVASHPPSLAAPLLRRSFLFQTPGKVETVPSRVTSPSHAFPPSTGIAPPLHPVEIISTCPARAPCVHPAARRWL